MFARIREDINSVLERDPAARSSLEVLLCYPGLWAVWIHRVANRLWNAKLRLPARVLSQIARFFTGVDIHPGARWAAGCSSTTPPASSSAKQQLSATT